MSSQFHATTIKFDVYPSNTFNNKPKYFSTQNTSTTPSEKDETSLKDSSTPRKTNLPPSNHDPKRDFQAEDDIQGQAHVPTERNKVEG